MVGGEQTGTLSNVLIGRYSTVAALTVLIYDFLVTLDAEIELVWRQKVCWGSVLFYINRYIPFVSVAVACHYILFEQRINNCQLGPIVFGVPCLIGLLSAEFVFLLRADAIWTHQRALRATLIAVFLLTSTACSYFLIEHLASVEVIKIQFFSGCLYSFERRNWALVLSFAACDFFAFTLFLAKRQADKALATTALMQTLYQESLLCFSLITALTAVNLVLEIAAPPTLLDNFIVPEAILTNIMCSRMLLGIRRVNVDSCRRSSFV